MQKIIMKTALLLMFLTLLTGCVFGGEQAMVNSDDDSPPQDITLVEDEEQLNNGDEELLENDDNLDGLQEEGVEFSERELYLIDSDGYVVPQTLQLPQTKEVAKQSLEYLVKNGPITEMLPNGFQAVLPQDTQVIGLNLEEDGTIIADFSNEFVNYRPEDELKILQAITWTLTQFDNVEKVQIRVNGVDQPFMPVNGTPINEGFSRANGINLDNSDIVDVTNSTALTLYFLNQNQNQTYYVPVTKRIQKQQDVDSVVTIVNELIEGPPVQTPLLSEFHHEMELLNEPTYEDGVVTLNFNEAVLGDLEGTAISNHFMHPLVLSLTEQEGIASVSIQVNGETEVYNEMGDVVSEPVSRPDVVDTRSF